MLSIFFFLTVAIWYYHAICIVLKYFASFTGHEDDIFEVILKSHIQESKFGGNIYKFEQKKKEKKFNSAKFMELLFSKSVWM